MKYLVDKESHVIYLDVSFDSKRHLWLEPGVVCWNPDIFCKEGEEEQSGCTVEDVPEKEMFKMLANGYSGNFYFINGQLLTEKPKEL